MVRIQLDDAVIPRVGNIDIVLIIDEDVLRLFEGASLCAEVGHHVTDLIGERRGQLIALGIDDVVGVGRRSKHAAGKGRRHTGRKEAAQYFFHIHSPLML